MDKSIVERFWNNVEILGPDQCWNWQSPPTKMGYGQFWLPGNRNVLAHRFALELTSGRNANGYKVGHHCDNPLCCNPAHLYVAEWAKKPHGNAGSKNHTARLSGLIARRIRAWVASNVFTQSQLARAYKVTPGAINQIINRSTYSHV